MLLNRFSPDYHHHLPPLLVTSLGGPSMELYKFRTYQMWIMMILSNMLPRCWRNSGLTVQESTKDCVYAFNSKISIWKNSSKRTQGSHFSTLILYDGYPFCFILSASLFLDMSPYQCI